jgi:hypothetical protein
MYLSQIPQNLAKLEPSDPNGYWIGDGLTKAEIEGIEAILHVAIPEQIKLFFSTFNGLGVTSPPFEIYPIERWVIKRVNKVEFAQVDGRHALFFDTAMLNQAGQWNIVSNTGYVVTHTMASFWSNKLWAWVRDRREIWKDDFSHERDEGS